MVADNEKVTAPAPAAPAPTGTTARPAPPPPRRWPAAYAAALLAPGAYHRDTPRGTAPRLAGKTRSPRRRHGAGSGWRAVCLLPDKVESICRCEYLTPGS